jgi:KUP system potassium uptake protein
MQAQQTRGPNAPALWTGRLRFVTLVSRRPSPECFMSVAPPSTVPLNGSDHHKSGSSTRFWALTIGTVGVVYGDIGTSPLYAFREALAAAVGPGPITKDAVLGVLSLIFWALILVVTVKYVLILLRADNNGEGGTLSLTALAFRAVGGRTKPILILGVIGAAMFYGSSFITPALSVMSAVEGLKVATPRFEPYVLPLTAAILIALFTVQSRGTGRIATFFGPIMVIWFVIMTIAGLVAIVERPGVLAAVSPSYALRFVVEHPMIGLVSLGFVLLAVTGGEALYADLGHFGRKPIQLAWLCLVLPALTINYFGQGALVLADPAAIESPFYRLFPEAMLVPMVVLATAATSIASQAVITGSYSLTRQAIQLGLLPRLEIRHTSEAHHGQIFIPRVNTILLIGVLFLVAMFQTSSALASAYGLAVAAAMLMDGLLAFIVIRYLWNFRFWSAALLTGPFILIDVAFLAATLMNFLNGAWVPILIGAVIALLVGTWRRGMNLLAQKTRRSEVPLNSLIRKLEEKPPYLVPGTAVFLTSQPEYAPTALLHNLKHNKMLHDCNLIVTVENVDIPRVSESDRTVVTQLSRRFRHVRMRFGFMETPNVPKALGAARKLGLKFDIMSTSFFLSRRALKPAAKSGMPRWQDRLFITLSRAANDATDYFRIPTGRVVEIGTQITV